MPFPDNSSFNAPKDISNPVRFLLSSASLTPANNNLTTTITGDM